MTLSQQFMLKLSELKAQSLTLNGHCIYNLSTLKLIMMHVFSRHFSSEKSSTFTSFFFLFLSDHRPHRV